MDLFSVLTQVYGITGVSTLSVSQLKLVTVGGRRLESKDGGSFGDRGGFKGTVPTVLSL